jgi:hypothetical protein
MNDVTGYYETALHPGQINIYYKSFTPRRRIPAPSFDTDQDPEPASHIPEQFLDNHHYGRISPVALKKITRAVQYLTFLVPKKRRYHTPDGRSGNYFLNFITLTLSSQQIHSDNEIKRSILEPFLNELRQRFRVSSYIWRAERQENGNIHFHVLSDRFIWWNDLRNSWNYFQERLGYVSRYRLSMQKYHKNGFQVRSDLLNTWPINKQLAAWRTGVRNDWQSPNSTDVHSLKSVGNVRSYLTKYITKSDDNSDIEGRLWGCSYNLTKLSGPVEFADGQISQELDTLLQDHRVRIYKTDYYTVIYFDPGLLVILHLFLLLALIRQFCRTRFPDHYSPELFDP